MVTVSFFQSYPAWDFLTLNNSGRAKPDLSSRHKSRTSLALAMKLCMSVVLHRIFQKYQNSNQGHVNFDDVIRFQDGH